ncbi:MAG: hypothetical protein Q4E94_06205 [Clostridia bacterium]|nr:hypothetical protein [Clostridia bacterium]
MTKKVLAAVLAASVMLPCGVRAASTDRFEGHWELDTTRTVNDTPTWSISSVVRADAGMVELQ